MDINNYCKMKKKGCITLSEFNGQLAISIKRFDPNTGEPEEPLMQLVSPTPFLNQVDETVKALEDQLNSLKQFKIDAKAVLVKGTKSPE